MTKIWRIQWLSLNLGRMNGNIRDQELVNNFIHFLDFYLQIIFNPVETNVSKVSDVVAIGQNVHIFAISKLLISVKK